MDLSPSRETDTSSAIQEIPSILFVVRLFGYLRLCSEENCSVFGYLRVYSE
jgi:hypothetical protein